MEGHRGGIPAMANRKLQAPALVQNELKLLYERVGQEETVVNMAHATMGFKPGLLVLTDHRIVWFHQGDREEVQRELPYADVTEVRMARYPKDVVTLRSPAGETAFSSVRPKQRGPEIVEEVQRRAAAARAPQ